MASVSSLDKDLRQVRLDRYTQAAANEVRTWIEGVLREKLPSGDLLEGLRDGVALCKLINLAVPHPGVKFKQSAMPFVQMENISIFLRACQASPFNLHQHDTFLTVDLYESKDPAQVLQCLGAFSRAANAVNPSKFPSPIGPRNRAGSVTPQGTGHASPLRDRGASITSNTSSAYGNSRTVLPHRTGDSGSGRQSPTKSPSHGSPGAVSSWSKREHESGTAPAWNIAQYGYMGGASQGNLGIAFGARRQITSTGPKVPSLADKERLRKEKEAEEERQRQEMEQQEHQRRREMEAEEARARAQEERRWEEETQRLRAEERRKADEEKRIWEEEERQWKLEAENRRREEAEVESRMAAERNSVRGRDDVKLSGQFLSQYQADKQGEDQNTGYTSRVRELEKELELARQREAEYEQERQTRSSRPPVEPRTKAKSRSRSRVTKAHGRHDSWSRDEGEFLRTQWDEEQKRQQQPKEQTPEVQSAPPTKPPRPLPDPTVAAARPFRPQENTSGSSRPLPDPAKYASPPQSRTDRFLNSNPAPAALPTQQTYSGELDATSERDAEDRRRQQSQSATKAGGWASKSLLEREMEMERQRQQEWEEAQKETAAAARSGDGVDGIGGGIGGRWDVGQWSGFTGGDGQNKGAQGIGAGRRQIVGPRPLPNPK